MPEDTGSQTPTPVQDPATPVDTPVPAIPTTSVTPPVVPTPPVTPAPLATPEDKTLSEEQVASITKDVSGKVGEEVSKSVIQKIGDALGLTKKEEDELPTDASALRKLVDSAVGKRFDRQSKDVVKQDKQDATVRQDRIDGIVTGWHFQYDQLSKLGKLPAIKNPNDTNDEGVVARRKLITTILLP